MGEGGEQPGHSGPRRDRRCTLVAVVSSFRAARQCSCRSVISNDVWSCTMQCRDRGPPATRTGTRHSTPTARTSDGCLPARSSARHATTTDSINASLGSTCGPSFAAAAAGAGPVGAGSAAADMAIEDRCGLLCETAIPDPPRVLWGNMRSTAAVLVLALAAAAVAQRPWDCSSKDYLGAVSVGRHPGSPPRRRARPCGRMCRPHPPRRPLCRRAELRAWHTGRLNRPSVQRQRAVPRYGPAPPC